MLKNFKKLHERGLELAFHQLRTDYVEKEMLRDVCAPEDIIYFGALILKVKLQAKILRSKQNKISPDLILKNIEYAVPGCFLEGSEGAISGRGRAPEHWMHKIEDGFFKKKEFLEYSVEDAQEKFLSGVGLYSLMFSTYYVVERRDPTRALKTPRARGGKGKAEAKARPEDEAAAESSDNISNGSSDSDKPGKHRAEDPIEEAGSSDEESGTFSGLDRSSTPDGLKAFGSH